MSFQARHARAVMAAPTHLEHFEVRQASPSSSSGIASATGKQSSSVFKAPPQPTSMVALTTTFTPPQTCFENRLSMLAPRYEVWANAPVPAVDVTSGACYPSEFLEAYTAVEVPGTTSNIIASSVVPAMSGFVCPANYCTQMTRANNYAACCPSGYLLQLPFTTVDRNRPAYGGTCYSPFSNGHTYAITKFDAAGDSVVVPLSNYKSDENAYANILDGFAASGATPTNGCPATSSLIFQSSSSLSMSSSTSPSIASSAAPSTTSEAAASSTVSKGTIAGASIAAVAGLAGLIFLVWFILRYVRRRKSAGHNSGPYSGHELADTGLAISGTNSAAKLAHHEKEGSLFVSEMPEKHGQVTGAYRQSHLNDGQGAFEMHGDMVPELEGGANKHGVARPADPKIGFAT